MFATSTWWVGGLRWVKGSRGCVCPKGIVADICWLGVGHGEGSCKCSENKDEEGRGSHIAGSSRRGVEKVSGYWSRITEESVGEVFIAACKKGGATSLFVGSIQLTDPLLGGLIQR